MNLECLTSLLTCHSTPGDEDSVRSLLLNGWDAAGLNTSQHGHFAISGELSQKNNDLPTLLVCAHMDSPGFIVEKINQTTIELVRLGGATLTEDTADCILKTKSGLHDITIKLNDDESAYVADWTEDVEYGDRACFRSVPQVKDGNIHSPFLDNRLGCFVLTEIADHMQKYSENSQYNIVLGATVCEEIGGFGAPVLANHIQPGLVICLDATYESLEQNVLLGNGPVLTISDASVIISCAQRDKVTGIFNSNSVPIQTEVYNYSGTDAKAFPRIGLECPVYALLLATRGNHTPEEVGSLTDIESLLKGIQALATHYSGDK